MTLALLRGASQFQHHHSPFLEKKKKKPTPGSHLQSPLKKINPLSRIRIVSLPDRIRRPPSLTQHPTHIKPLLLLLLNRLPQGSLLALLPVEIGFHTGFAAAAEDGRVIARHGVGDLAFPGSGHLFGFEFVAAADVLVGVALGFFAGAGAVDATAETAGGGFGVGGLLGGDALVAGGRRVSWGWGWRVGGGREARLTLVVGRLLLRDAGLRLVRRAP